MKVRLFEIFTSVEGEGILYGTKTLFVRLAGCPFTCFYCDTKESLPLDSGTEYSIEDANKLIDSNLKNEKVLNKNIRKKFLEIKKVVKEKKGKDSQDLPIVHF